MTTHRIEHTAIIRLEPETVLAILTAHFHAVGVIPDEAETQLLTTDYDGDLTTPSTLQLTWSLTEDVEEKING